MPRASPHEAELGNGKVEARKTLRNERKAKWAVHLEQLATKKKTHFMAGEVRRLKKKRTVYQKKKDAQVWRRPAAVLKRPAGRKLKGNMIQKRPAQKASRA